MAQLAQERRERVCETDTWEGTSGRGNSKCKGPEAPENMDHRGISKSSTLARRADVDMKQGHWGLSLE